MLGHGTMTKRLPCSKLKGWKSAIANLILSMTNQTDIRRGISSGRACIVGSSGLRYIAGMMVTRIHALDVE